MKTIHAVLSAILDGFSERISLFVLAVLTAALLGLGYVALVVPNASFVEIFLNDVFGLTDAAYRSYAGRVPSVEFRSLYGAATYYPAALGFYFGLEPGAVLAFGHFVTAVFLLGMTVLVSYRRIPTLQSVLLAVFVFLLVMVPVRLGGIYTDLTFGIYYTRHGWAALTVVLMFYLDPRIDRRSDLVLDSVVLSALLLYVFYLKVTFAAVALAFVVANALTSRYKLYLSIASLSVFVLVVGAIHFFTAYGPAYLGDIFTVVDQTDAVRRGPMTMFWMMMDHLGVFLLCLTALMAVYLKGRRDFFDFAFVVGSVLASLMIFDQSGGIDRGTPGLLAVLLILGELVRRQESATTPGTPQASWNGNVASTLIFGMTLAFAAEPMLTATRALSNHQSETVAALSRGGPGLSGIFVKAPNGRTHLLHEALGHDEEGHERFGRLRPRELKASEYMPLVQEGVDLLRSVDLEGRSVVSFEQTSPFTVLLGLKPTKYGYPLHWINPEKSVSSNDLESPGSNLESERFFSDADYVMVPAVPYNAVQLGSMVKLYGPYLQQNFREIKRSPHWKLYARK